MNNDKTYRSPAAISLTTGNTLSTSDGAECCSMGTCTFTLSQLLKTTLTNSASDVTALLCFVNETINIILECRI